MITSRVALASTHPTNTLSAPRIVTRAAGMNPNDMKLAPSPTPTVEIRIKVTITMSCGFSLVRRPAHQSHSFKYAYPPLPNVESHLYSVQLVYSDLYSHKPALWEEVRDTLSRPFFLRMKLLPMNTLELMARVRPMINC